MVITIVTGFHCFFILYFPLLYLLYSKQLMWIMLVFAFGFAYFHLISVIMVETSASAQLIDSWLRFILYLAKVICFSLTVDLKNKTISRLAQFILTSHTSQGTPYLFFSANDSENTNRRGDTKSVAKN